MATGTTWSAAISSTSNRRPALTRPLFHRISTDGRPANKWRVLAIWVVARTFTLFGIIAGSGDTEEARSRCARLVRCVSGYHCDVFESFVAGLLYDEHFCV